MKHWHETAAILARARALAQTGVPTALATVVRLDGSGYRRPGAKLLIAPGQVTLGGVSGGCLEADVREVALACLADGRPRSRRYDTREGDENPFALGLGCDGVVDIFVRPVAADTDAALGEADALLEGEAPFAICTPLSGDDAGRSAIVASTGGDGEACDPDWLDAGARAAATRAIAEGRSTVHEAGAAPIFIDVLTPPPRLLVLGGGDDAVPLVATAAGIGLRVTVVDHRPAFADPSRLPGAARVALQRPEAGVGDLLGADGPPRAAVVMTHSLGLDRAWLRALVATDVAYIGLLGPRSRGADLIAEVGAQGDPRVHAPVGLDLGAEGPEQIALSVVAEVLAVLRGRRAGHMRDASPRAPDVRVA